MREHFGNDMLYYVLKYRKEHGGNSPRDYRNLFDWLRFEKTEAIIRDTLIASMRRK
jgi:hypothetical protein